MRFMVETDLKLSGCVSADTLAALRAEGYDYKDGNLVPAGKEETMQEKVANTTPAAPLKLDVSVRVIEPVKNLMGFASVKFNDCFVVENLKIVQGSKSSPFSFRRMGCKRRLAPFFGRWTEANPLCTGFWQVKQPRAILARSRGGRNGPPLSHGKEE